MGISVRLAAQCSTWEEIPRARPLLAPVVFRRTVKTQARHTARSVPVRTRDTRSEKSAVPRRSVCFARKKSPILTRQRMSISFLVSIRTLFYFRSPRRVSFRKRQVSSLSVLRALLRSVWLRVSVLLALLLFGSFNPRLRVCSSVILLAHLASRHVCA